MIIRDDWKLVFFQKSVSYLNLPVTIKYPEMVAKIAPHFDGDGIPMYGKDNLWFFNHLFFINK